MEKLFFKLLLLVFCFTQCSSMGSMFAKEKQKKEQQKQIEKEGLLGWLKNGNCINNSRRNPQYSIPNNYAKDNTKHSTLDAWLEKNKKAKQQKNEHGGGGDLLPQQKQSFWGKIGDALHGLGGYASYVGKKLATLYGCWAPKTGFWFGEKVGNLIKSMGGRWLVATPMILVLPIPSWIFHTGIVVTACKTLYCSVALAGTIGSGVVPVLLAPLFAILSFSAEAGMLYKMFWAKANDDDGSSRKNNVSHNNRVGVQA